MSASGTYLINFTPTGMLPTRAMTPHVPLRADEIVAETLAAAELGATMIHLHARDPSTEEPTFEAARYAELISGIRAHRPDLILCVSTSGRLFPEFEQRAQCLDLAGDLRPDFASLTLSSLNFNKQASINSPDMICALAARMQERGIRPELEVFDLGMINYARYLIRKEIIRPPYYFNLILGNIACAQADALNLGLMIRELPEPCSWSAGGIGHAQFKMNTMALLEGGGVRIGLEDNIWYDEARTRLATNRDLLERLIAAGHALGLRPCTTAEARERLGLSP